MTGHILLYLTLHHQRSELADIAFATEKTVLATAAIDATVLAKAAATVEVTASLLVVFATHVLHGIDGWQSHDHPAFGTVPLPGRLVRLALLFVLAIGVIEAKLFWVALGAVKMTPLAQFAIL